MPTHGKRLRFPHYIFEKTNGRGESDIIITETEGDEARDKIGHRRRLVTISSAKMNNEQHEEFQTFCDLVEDSYVSFLMMDIHRYRLKDELIGVGDGVNKTFQLQRTRTLEGKTNVQTVYCPDHDYPPIFLPAALGQTPIQFWPRHGEDGRLHIFVGGIEYSIDTSTPAKLDALRYGGQVVLNSAPPDEQEVRARGYEYRLMRFEGKSPDTAPSGGGFWMIEGTIAMIEPKNIERELAAIRAEAAS